MSEPGTAPPKKSRDHFLLLGCVGAMLIFPCLMISPLPKMLMAWGASGLVHKVDSGCKIRLGKLQKAVSLYAADNDEGYPIADTWVDYTWTYGAKKDPEEESESVFRCTKISMTRTGEYGYGFNGALSGVKTSSVSDPGKTPLIFDSSNLKRDASGDPNALLPKPPRHNSDKNNNAVMASGKVEEMP